MFAFSKIAQGRPKKSKASEVTSKLLHKSKQLNENTYEKNQNLLKDMKSSSSSKIDTVDLNDMPRNHQKKNSVTRHDHHQHAAKMALPMERLLKDVANSLAPYAASQWLSSFFFFFGGGWFKLGFAHGVL